MTLQPEVKEIIERNMDLMLRQTKSYLPFLKIAFPAVRDLSEMCYNLMVGNAPTTFLSQYALRMQNLGENDFTEFGALVEQYRQKVKEMF
ncbi:MAG: hypothetical protein WAN47_10395 [Nitrosotalea sp.]